MLSDVTIAVSSHTVTFSSWYLVLLGCFLILGLASFVVALTNSRRVELKASHATDVLMVQLQRIGDSLDRIVGQNAARAAAEPPQRSGSFFPEWPVPGRGIPPRVTPERAAAERLAEKFAPQAQSEAVPEQLSEPQLGQAEPVHGTVSEPARSILFSMLGR